MMKVRNASFLVSSVFTMALASTAVLAANDNTCPGKTSGTSAEYNILNDLDVAYSGPQAPMQVVENGVDADAGARDMARLHAELVRADGGMLLLDGFRADLDQAELARLSEGRQDERRVLVGIEKPVGARVEFGGRQSRKVGPVSGGMLLQGTSRQRVWLASVRSEDASALRVRFSDVHLAPGAALYVYNTTGLAFGPYTAADVSEDGDLWSNTVDGSELRVQLVAADSRALSETSFTLADVAHVGSGFHLAMRRAPGLQPKAFCNVNAPCVENARCFDNTDWNKIDQVRRAVAHYIFQSGGGSYICSGGLLADTVQGSDIPYFLTANHCMSTPAEVRSIEAFWKFTTACGAGCYGAVGNVPSTRGATLLATSAAQDFTFMKLRTAPPAPAVYLGWTTNPVAFSNGTPLYRISHPKGAPQAFSRHSVDTAAGTCQGLPRGNFIYSRDTLGGIEGGSSGSVVMNSQAQVVGQLLGTCGFDPESVCDNVSNATVDGAFAASFAKMKPWLNP
jgi:V8-like Glu-specific endopeptidase